MNKRRLIDIMNSNDIQELYYNEQPVWVQSVKDDIAHIGFMHSSEEKDVYIDDLYEQNLYNE